MIIIPELETIVILTPRTGTRALRYAIAATHPQSYMLYRHMEADGVPAGYDRWRRVGVVRPPLERLWSLYRYLKIIGESRAPDGKGKWDPTYVERQRASAAIPFNDWITGNQLVFTSPYHQVSDHYFPPFTVRHPVPENRKSQFIYLRPDLGTEVWQYRDVADLHRSLGVEPERCNAGVSEAWPEISDEAADHVRRFFKWDLEVTNEPL